MNYNPPNDIIAVRFSSRTLTINPARLQAGHLYDLEARLWCAGWWEGIRAEFYQKRPDRIGWRVYLDGRLVRDPFNTWLSPGFDPIPHPDYSRYGRAAPYQIELLPSPMTAFLKIPYSGDKWIYQLYNPNQAVIYDNYQYILAEVESGWTPWLQGNISFPETPSARVTSYQENTEIVRVNNQEIERITPQYGLTEEGLGIMYTLPDLRLRSLATCTPQENPETGMIPVFDCGSYSYVYTK